MTHHVQYIHGQRVELGARIETTRGKGTLLGWSPMFGPLLQTFAVHLDSDERSCWLDRDEILSVIEGDGPPAGLEFDVAPIEGGEHYTHRVTWRTVCRGCGREEVHRDGWCVDCYQPTLTTGRGTRPPLP